MCSCSPVLACTYSVCHTHGICNKFQPDPAGNFYTKLRFYHTLTVSAGNYECAEVENFLSIWVLVFLTQYIDAWIFFNNCYSRTLILFQASKFVSERFVCDMWYGLNYNYKSTCFFLRKKKMKSKEEKSFGVRSLKFFKSVIVVVFILPVPIHNVYSK